MTFKDLIYLKKEDNYDVGILSVNINSGICNFGAALHSFALQKYLDKKGVSNVIINYYPESIKKIFITTKILESLKKFDFRNLFINIFNSYFIFRKKYKFLRFYRKNCRITKSQYDIKTLSKLNSINRYIVDTDVTWMKYKTGFDRGFFCDLANMRTKDNIAYSVDFGSNLFSDKDAAIFKNFMLNFKHISLRNIFKIDYFKTLTGRNDAVITIDPVLLLDKEDYYPFAKKANIKEEYVFVFNCVENNQEMVQNAQAYAKEHNLKIVIVNSFVNGVVDWKKSFPTPIGLEDFLGYIQNCKCFFTNSYHGICFGIIFEKPLYCYARKGNSEKILTLLNLFKMDERLVRDNKLPEDEIDYVNLRKNWLKLRQESEAFIEKSIINNDINNNRRAC